MTIDDKDLGTFNSCEGLGVEVVLEQREEGGNNGFVWQLPTRLKYTNVKLSRPLGPDTDEDRRVVREHDHRRQAQDGDDRRRCNAMNEAGRELEPVGRRPGPLDRARASTSSRRRSRPRRSRSPTTASCRPERGRRRWPRKPIALHAAAGRRAAGGADARASTRAALELLRARRRPAGGSKPGALDRPDPVPVQPQGTDDLEVGEVGAQARARGARRAGPPEFNGRGPVQAHPGDVLRRHRHHGRQRRRPASSSSSPAACRPTRASAKKKAVAAARGAALGQGHELRRVRHVGAGQVHAVHRRTGTPIRATCNVSLRGDARRPAASRTRRPAALARPSRAHGRRRRHARLDRLPRVRRPDAVAPARRVQRHRRPAAAAARAPRCCCPPSTTSWPGCDVAEAQISNAFTIIDRRDAAARRPRAAARRPRDVDDSLNLPDLFVLRFRDPDRIVLAKTGVEDRREARGRGDQQRRRRRRSR